MTFADKLAHGLAAALNLRDPDLAWEPVPLDADQGYRDTGTAEVRRLHPLLDDGDPTEAAPLPDPDHADRAA